MGNRLSKIATRTGDAGMTGLGDGSRVEKDHLRICAMGDVDELNSQIGVLMTEELPPSIASDLQALLLRVQHDLFDLGSGIMGETLSNGNAAVALLGNSIATGAGLYVLIVLLGPISGAHFNPVVSL
ncbi:MAG: hypothetical protein EBY06_03125, partial [Burkholderiaceae bacterium]|nr:hypothetical protein [Burkholderiaceae bacterium]